MLLHLEINNTQINHISTFVVVIALGAIYDSNEDVLSQSFSTLTWSKHQFQSLWCNICCAILYCGAQMKMHLSSSNYWLRILVLVLWQELQLLGSASAILSYFDTIIGYQCRQTQHNIILITYCQWHIYIFTTYNTISANTIWSNISSNSMDRFDIHYYLPSILSKNWRIVHSHKCATE